MKVTMQTRNLKSANLLNFPFRANIRGCMGMLFGSSKTTTTKGGGGTTTA